MEREKLEFRARTLGIFDYRDKDDDHLKRLISCYELFELVHPPEYDKPNNTSQQYCLNGKPMILREKVSLTKLKAKAKEQGI